MSAVEMNFHVRGIGKTWPRATVRLPLPSASSTAIQHSHNGHLGIDFRQLNVGIIKSTAKRPQNVFRKLAASANKLKRFEWKSPQCDQVGQSQQSSVAYCAPRCLVPSPPHPHSIPLSCLCSCLLTVAQTREHSLFFIHLPILLFNLKRRHNNNLSPGM